MMKIRIIHHLFVLLAVVLLNAPVSVHAQESGFAIVALKKAASSPQALKGKAIAIHGSSTNFLSEFLEKAGLKIPDVRLVPARQSKGMKKKQKSPAALFRDRKLAAAVVSMSEAMTLTLNDTIGDGTNGSVKGAIILKFESDEDQRDEGMDEAEGQEEQNASEDNNTDGSTSGEGTPDSQLNTASGPQDERNTPETTASGQSETPSESTTANTQRSPTGTSIGEQDPERARQNESTTTGQAQPETSDPDTTLTVPGIPGQSTESEGRQVPKGTFGQSSTEAQTSAGQATNESSEQIGTRADQARSLSTQGGNAGAGSAGIGERDSGTSQLNTVGDTPGSQVESTEDTSLVGRLRNAWQKQFSSKEESTQSLQSSETESTPNTSGPNLSGRDFSITSQDTTSTPPSTTPTSRSTTSTTPPTTTSSSTAPPTPTRQTDEAPPTSTLIRNPAFTEKKTNTNNSISPEAQLTRLQEQADIIANLHNACIYAREGFYSLPYPLEASYDFKDLFDPGYLPEFPQLTGSLNMLLNLSPMSCNSDLVLKAQIDPAFGLHSTCYEERRACKEASKTPDWCFDEEKKAQKTDLSPCAIKPEGGLKECYSKITACGKLPNVSNPAKMSSDNSDLLVEEVLRGIDASSLEWEVPLLETDSVIALEDAVRDRSIHWRKKLDPLTFAISGLNYEQSLLVKRPIFTMSDSEAAKITLEKMDESANTFFENLAKEVMNLYIVNVTEVSLEDLVEGAAHEIIKSMYRNREEIEVDINKALTSLDFVMNEIDLAIAREKDGKDAFNAEQKANVQSLMDVLAEDVLVLVISEYAPDSNDFLDTAAAHIEDEKPEKAKKELEELEDHIKKQDNVLSEAFPPSESVKIRDVVCTGVKMPQLLLDLTIDVAKEFTSITPFNENYDALFTPASCETGASPEQISQDIEEISLKIDAAQKKFVSFGWFFDIVKNTLKSPVLQSVYDELEEAGIDVKPSIRDELEEAKDGAEGVFLSVMSAISHILQGQFMQAIKVVWNTMKNSIANKIRATAGQTSAGNIFTKAKNTIKGLLEKLVFTLARSLTIALDSFRMFIVIMRNFMISMKIVANFFGIYQMHKERLAIIVKGLEYAKIRSSFTAEGCGGSTPTSRPALERIHEELEKFYEWRQAQIDAPEGEEIFDTDLFNEYMEEFDEAYTAVRDNPCARNVNEKLLDHLVDPPPLPPYIIREPVETP